MTTTAPVSPSLDRTAPLYGLVLAGGKSSRMGTDKAGLIHPDGRTLARRSAELLAEAGCERVFLSLRRGQNLSAGVAEAAVIRDPEASLGPLSGMTAAMARHPAADWLIVACDLPRLDAATLRHLIESAAPEPFLAYRSEADGLPEPLCALYRSQAGALLHQALEDGVRCPRKVLMRHRCRLLEPVSGRALENANTPADWEFATNS